MRRYKNILVAALLAGLFVCFIAASIHGKKPEAENVSYTEFLSLLGASRVASVTLSEGASMSFALHGDDTKYSTDNPRKNDLKETLLLEGVAVNEAGASAAEVTFQTAVSIACFAGAFYIVYRASGRAGVKSGMAVNAAVAEGDSGSCSFSDVAGNEEAKECVEDIVDFMRNPEKYASYGARVPRGVIFYGPPGTGKTLMARAMAGEAGVPFFAVSGSDFVQMYVGVGAGRIRELFKKARKCGKAVVFIDEIDALGKKRSLGAGGASDERDQTLNALLTEMSGFASGEGVVVIAATNRVDKLDEALLRPGRFDRLVEVGLPDMAARRSILACHARNKPLAEDVSLDGLAKETVFFSGAMLENYLNEAAIISAKAGKPRIEARDLEKAYYTILAGSEKKNRPAAPDIERRVTAFHEAGHALVGRIAAPETTIAKMTIIPSAKGAGGYCVHIPQEKMFYTKKELRAQIMVSLGGRAAEELVFGTAGVTTGAVNDLEKATAIACDYVSKYGMGEKTGLLRAERFGGEAGQLAMAECRLLLETLYNDATTILEENIHKLNRLAGALIERESLNAGDLERLVG